MNLIIMDTSVRVSRCVSADSREEIARIIAESIPEGANTLTVSVDDTKTVNVQNMLLTLIDSHNDVLDAVHSVKAKIDADNIKSWMDVINAQLRSALLLTSWARQYGLPADCPNAAARIEVDWSKILEDDPLAQSLMRMAVQEGLLEKVAEDPDSGMALYAAPDPVCGKETKDEEG